MTRRQKRISSHAEPSTRAPASISTVTVSPPYEVLECEKLTKVRREWRYLFVDTTHQGNKPLLSHSAARKVVRRGKPQSSRERFGFPSMQLLFVYKKTLPQTPITSIHVSSSQTHACQTSACPTVPLLPLQLVEIQFHLV